ncbi:hypothetical protein [Actinoplanes sp. URMC 104]|uniref:hypothetical protein n=1 Tax=Actinoplanes sp. URMC 104 TaxID=3423409 RepID=UPI003F1AA0D9
MGNASPTVVATDTEVLVAKMRRRVSALQALIHRSKESKNFSDELVGRLDTAFAAALTLFDQIEADKLSAFDAEVEIGSFAETAFAQFDDCQNGNLEISRSFLFGITPQIVELRKK